MRLPLWVRFISLATLLLTCLVLSARMTSATALNYCRDQAMVDYPACTTIPGWPTGYYDSQVVTGECCKAVTCAQGEEVWTGTTYPQFQLQTNGFGSWCFTTVMGQPGGCCGAKEPDGL